MMTAPTGWHVAGEPAPEPALCVGSGQLDAWTRSGWTPCPVCGERVAVESIIGTADTYALADHYPPEIVDTPPTLGL